MNLLSKTTTTPSFQTPHPLPKSTGWIISISPCLIWRNHQTTSLFLFSELMWDYSRCCGVVKWYFSLIHYAEHVGLVVVDGSLLREFVFQFRIYHRTNKRNKIKFEINYLILFNSVFSVYSSPTWHLYCVSMILRSIYSYILCCWSTWPSISCCQLSSHISHLPSIYWASVSKLSLYSYRSIH